MQNSNLHPHSKSRTISKRLFSTLLSFLLFGLIFLFAQLLKHDLHAQVQGASTPQLRAEVVQQMGGASNAIETNGKNVFLANGARVLIFDAQRGLTSDPLAWTDPLPGLVDVIHYARGHLFIGVSHQSEGLRQGGLAIVNVSDPSRPQIIDYHESGVMYQDILSHGSMLWATGSITFTEGLQRFYSYRTGMEIWDIANAAEAYSKNWVDLYDTSARYLGPQRITIARHKKFLVAASVGSFPETIELSVYDSRSETVGRSIASLRLYGNLDSIFADDSGLHVLGRGSQDAASRHWLIDLSSQGHFIQIGEAMIGHQKMDGCLQHARSARGPKAGQWWNLNPCTGAVNLYHSGPTGAVETLYELRLESPRDLTSYGPMLWIAEGIHGGAKQFEVDETSFSVAEVGARALIGSVDHIEFGGSQPILGLSTGHLASIPSIGPRSSLEHRLGPELGEIRDIARSANGQLTTLASDKFMLIDEGSLSVAGSTQLGESPASQLIAVQDGFIVNAMIDGVKRIEIGESGPFVSAHDDSLNVEYLRVEDNRLLVLGIDTRVGGTRLAALNAGDLARLPSEDWMTSVEQTLPDLGENPKQVAFGSIHDQFLLVGNTSRPHGWEKSVAMRFDKTPPLRMVGVTKFSYALGPGPNSVEEVGDHLLLAARDGLIALSSVVGLENPNVNLLWNAHSRVSDIHVLPRPAGSEGELLVAAGEAGVFRIRLMDASDATATPRQTAVPAPTIEPSPTATTRTTMDEAANQVYLPMITRRMAPWKHVNGLNESLTYIEMRAGVTGAMATEGDLLLRDESGQLVVYQWNEEEELIEAARGPVVGEHARDILIDGDRAYVATGDKGVIVYDIRSSLWPKVEILQEISVGSPVRSLAIFEQYLFASAKENIYQIDLSGSQDEAQSRFFASLEAFDRPGPIEFRVFKQYLIAFSLSHPLATARMFDLRGMDEGNGVPFLSAFTEQRFFNIQDILFLESENRMLVLLGDGIRVFDISEIRTPSFLGLANLTFP